MWEHNTSTFSHEILWRAAQSALRVAQIPHAHVVPQHLAIQGLLCGVLAFEGFVNFVGAEVLPEIWNREREYFGHGKFQGLEGKVAYLFTRYDGATLDKGADPYQTFLRLKRARDTLAHSRVFQYREITEDGNPTFSTSWEEFASPDRVQPALAQVRDLAEMIRLEAVKLLKEEYRVSHLHFPAFGGPIGSSSGSSISG